MSSSKKSPFLREASGLVKEFGIIDTLWINVGIIGLPFSTYYTASTGPLVGGNPILGSILPLVGSFLIGLLFSYIGSKVPRVAADYVYVSRNLNPALGFVGNGGYFLSLMLFVGINAIIFVTFGIVPLITIVGYYTNNSALISLGSIIDSNTYLIMAIGAIEIVIMSLIPIFGNKIYKTFQWLVPFTIIGIISIIITEIVIPQSVAISRLNDFALYYANVTNLYQYISSSNVSIPAYNSFYNIISLNPVYLVVYSYAIAPVYVAGEVRNPRKSMPFSILGGLAISGFIVSAALALEYYQFGYDFTAKMMYLSIVRGSLPIPTPYLDLLEGVASGNVVLGVFFALASMFQFIVYTASAAFIGSRLLFSYSMDRILPDFVADINEKRHVPLKAILLSLAVGLIMLVVVGLPVTSAVALLLSSVAIAIIMLFPIATVAISVLKAEKDNTKIRIISIIALPYLIYTFYQYLTVPALGADTIVGYAILAGCIAILFVIFYCAKIIRTRQGINFDLIFKEIPPE